MQFKAVWALKKVQNLNWNTWYAIQSLGEGRLAKPRDQIAPKLDLEKLHEVMQNRQT